MGCEVTRDVEGWERGSGTEKSDGREAKKRRRGSCCYCSLRPSPSQPDETLYNARPHKQREEEELCTNERRKERKRTTERGKNKEERGDNNYDTCACSKNECSSARSTSTPPLFSSCVGEGSNRVSTTSDKGKKEGETTTNRIALGHQRLPLPDQPLHLILRRLPHRLKNLILLRGGVRHIPSKVLVNALVQLVDRFAEVLRAHVGSGTAEGGTGVGVVEGDFGRWGSAEELFEAGEEVLCGRRKSVLGG
jgi:hypothetical protein